ncbi:xanthine dehydrogenase family protein molybdopterin-binding subunit [candidate division KSB1 bacterium]
MTGWKPLEKMKHLGRRVNRIDIHYRVTGAAKYTHDVNLPDMLYGAILRSPHPHANIRSIESGAARAAAGVKAVFVFDKKKALYAGDEVAAVAAITQEAAAEALKLIRVDYEVMPFAASMEDSMEPGAPVIHSDGNIRGGKPREKGNLNSGMRRASAVIEGRFSTPMVSHSCLETHSAVARWEGDELTVWVSTQGVYSMREAFAKHFEMPAAKVRVICEFMGGGFGSKFPPGGEGIAAASLAREAGAPVKLLLNRAEEQLCAGYRPSSMQRIRMGATRDGKIVAFDIDDYGSGGYSVGASFPSPYIYEDIPNVRRRHRDVFINAGNARPHRAPGHPQASYGMEQAMDLLAEKLAMDPLELRKLNDPNEIRQRECVIGAERIGWHRRQNNPGSELGPIKRGLGLGCTRWSGGGWKEANVDLTINPDGSVEAAMGTQCLGTGTRTYIAMIVAEQMGIPLETVSVRIGDSVYPTGTDSGGSTTAACTAPAIKNGADAALRELFGKAARKLSAEPGELAAGEGRIFVDSAPERGLDWKDACRLLGGRPITVLGEWSEGLSGSGSAGVQFAEVEVDVGTGKVRVIKLVAVHDCGLILNSLTTESQIHGGVIMGLGYALLEDRIYDTQEGMLLNPNMGDYKVPGSLEIPEIDVQLLNMPERGVIGIGEPPIIPTAGAVANAVANAIGARVYDLPITPDKVLTALGKA